MYTKRKAGMQKIESGGIAWKEVKQYEMEWSVRGVKQSRRPSRIGIETKLEEKWRYRVINGCKDKTENKVESCGKEI